MRNLSTEMFPFTATDQQRASKPAKLGPDYSESDVASNVATRPGTRGRPNPRRLPTSNKARTTVDGEIVLHVVSFPSATANRARFRRDVNALASLPGCGLQIKSASDHFDYEKSGLRSINDF